MLANGTSHSTSQIQSIQQCIWDHGIFCVMLDFLHYQSPPLNNHAFYDEQIEREAAGLFDSVVEDCTFTLADGVEEVSPCAAGVITPSTAFRHIVTSSQWGPLFPKLHAD
jgi:hypothetical protein